MAEKGDEALCQRTCQSHRIGKYVGKAKRTAGFHIVIRINTVSYTHLDVYKRQVRTHFQNIVFKTVIQRNVKLGEAPSHGESIISYDATSRGAEN